MEINNREAIGRKGKEGGVRPAVKFMKGSLCPRMIAIAGGIWLLGASHALSQSVPWIRVSPDPCPVASGSAQCNATLSWNAGNGQLGRVWLKQYDKSVSLTQLAAPVTEIGCGSLVLDNPINLKGIAPGYLYLLELAPALSCGGATAYNAAQAPLATANLQALLPAPVIQGPLQEAFPESAVLVPLSWQPVLGAKAYNVRVYVEDHTLRPTDLSVTACPEIGSIFYLCANGLTSAALNVPVIAGHFYHWFVEAVDVAAGGQNAALASHPSAIGAFSVGPPPISLAITFPSNETVLSPGTDVPIMGIASDVSSVELSYQFEDGSTAQALAVLSGPFNPFTYTWATPTASGRYTLIARACDSASPAHCAEKRITARIGLGGISVGPDPCDPSPSTFFVRWSAFYLAADETAQVRVKKEGSPNLQGDYLYCGQSGYVTVNGITAERMHDFLVFKVPVGQASNCEGYIPYATEPPLFSKKLYYTNAALTTDKSNYFTGPAGDSSSLSEFPAYFLSGANPNEPAYWSSCPESEADRKPSNLLITDSQGSLTHSEEGIAPGQAGSWIKQVIAGNSIAKAEFTVTLDNTPPTVSITAPASAMQREIITISGQASDTQSGVKKASAAIDGGTSLISSEQDLTGSSFSFLLSVPQNINAGAHALTVTVFDKVGNAGTASVPITINALPSFVVGNVAPLKNDLNADGDAQDAGEFGDGQFNEAKLKAELRAVAKLSAPPPCSDLFQAMDLAPADTAAQKGGNGILNEDDLKVLLRKVAGLDATRHERARQPCTVNLEAP